MVKDPKGVSIGCTDASGAFQAKGNPSAKDLRSGPDKGAGVVEAEFAREE